VEEQLRSTLRAPGWVGEVVARRPDARQGTNHGRHVPVGSNFGPAVSGRIGTHRQDAVEKVFVSNLEAYCRRMKERYYTDGESKAGGDQQPEPE